MAKNIAMAQVTISYRGKKYKSEYWANAGGTNLMPPGKGVETIDHPKWDPLMVDVDPKKRIRGYDSEVKILKELDEDIARLATELGIHPSKLKIDVKLYSTFEPCNVCKRELVARKQLFSNATFEIYTPFYTNDEGRRVPVTGTKSYMESFN